MINISLTCSTIQYMGFGLSGSNSSTFMVGADATIAWVDNLEGTPNAEDYHLSGRFQVLCVYIRIYA